MATLPGLSPDSVRSLDSLIATRPHWRAVLSEPDFVESQLDLLIEDILDAVSQQLDALARSEDTEPINLFAAHLLSLVSIATSYDESIDLVMNQHGNVHA
jgi:hypothetical protein